MDKVLQGLLLLVLLSYLSAAFTPSDISALVQDLINILLIKLRFDSKLPLKPFYIFIFRDTKPLVQYTLITTFNSPFLPSGKFADLGLDLL